MQFEIYWNYTSKIIIDNFCKFLLRRIPFFIANTQTSHYKNGLLCVKQVSSCVSCFVKIVKVHEALAIKNGVGAFLYMF